MIIAHIYHPTLRPHIGNHPDYGNQQMYSMATYKFVAEYSEYCKNHDVILYETGGEVGNLTYPLKSFVNDDLLKKVIEKKAFLGIDTSYESKYEYIESIYKSIVVEQNIPAEQIYVIGHSLDYKQKIVELSKKYNKPIIGFEFYPLWVRLQQSIIKQTFNELGYTDYSKYSSGISSKNTKKKFLLFNNNWATHRLVLLSLLKNRKLIDEGYCSFSGAPARRGLLERKRMEFEKFGSPIPQYLLDEEQNTLEQNWNNWIKDCLAEFTDYQIQKEIHNGSDVYTRLPLVLDNRAFSLDLAWLSQRNIIKYYKESYFSVVTETFFSNDRPRHNTEKLFKAISHKHPFVYCSNTNALEILNVFGYKTYSEIINEEYDKEVDNSKRMLMVVNEIERLCNLTANGLENFKNVAEEIADYNFNLFMNQKNWIKRII